LVRISVPESTAGYQSFVIRVFCDDSERFDHGEVLHVSTRSRLRFKDWQEALNFMATFADAVATTDGVAVSPFPPLAISPAGVSAGYANSVRYLPGNGAFAAPAPAVPPGAAPLPEPISAAPVGRKRLQLIVKRVFDIAVSAAGIAVLSIPMLLIAIAIRLDSRGPLIYRTQRASIGGRIFTMYKFRSMVENADDMMPYLAEQNERDGPVFKIREDPRKTRVGHLLRRFSLDELPQLFNVFKGDLSLIGPRPPLASEVEVYMQEHWRRLAMPQGMTGLWQVSGRSLLHFDEMLKLDLEYIHSWSLWLDFKILLKTIPVVLSGRGAF
jgi:lipopolysaccharide/colanic/teichoic acid biosynthesis glycosyltransferase